MEFPSKEEARARYWQLRRAIEAVEAATAPLREARDAAYNEARAADEVAMAAIHAVEADVGVEGLDMFAAKNQMAACARYVGNVGEGPG